MPVPSAVTRPLRSAMWRSIDSEPVLDARELADRAVHRQALLLRGHARWISIISDGQRAQARRKRDSRTARRAGAADRRCSRVTDQALEVGRPRRLEVAGDEDLGQRAAVERGRRTSARRSMTSSANAESGRPRSATSSAPGSSVMPGTTSVRRASAWSAGGIAGAEAGVVVDERDGGASSGSDPAPRARSARHRATSVATPVWLSRRGRGWDEPGSFGIAPPSACTSSWAVVGVSLMSVGDD